jgi:hypothetical protein
MRDTIVGELNARNNERDFIQTSRREHRHDG